MGLFIIGVIETIVVAMVTRAFGKKSGRCFATILFALVAVPFLVIGIGAALGMVTSEPEAGESIKNSATSIMTAYFSNELPGVVIADFIGAGIGYVLGSLGYQNISS